MKRLLCYILTIAFLLSLTACEGKTNITGIWEQEMETAILGKGIEEATSVASLRRFTFREDGTGLQEHIMMDERYPDAVREFTYRLEGDILTLDFGGGQTEDFTAVLTETSLKLENRQGSFDLTKAE